MIDLPKRKYARLKEYDYSQEGLYFITVCAKDIKCVFGTIVGCGVLDAPQIQYSEYGKIIYNQIIEMNEIYDNVKTKSFVIMPNHLHLIIEIRNESGASRTPHPTNSIVSTYIETLK